MDFRINSSEMPEHCLNSSKLLDADQVAVYLYNCYLYLMIILGVSGNFIVLFVFHKLPPNTTTDWFIFSITTCDFISSLINVPIYASFTNGLWKYYGSNIVCKLHMTLSQSFVISSVFLICGLATDRYLKVCKLTSYSKTKARNICILMSIVTLFLSSPCFVMWENKEMNCKLASNGYGVFVYYLLVFLMYVIATSMVVFSYRRILRKVQECRRVLNRQSQLSSTSYSGRSKSLSRRITVNKVAPATTQSQKRSTTIHRNFKPENHMVQNGSVIHDTKQIFYRKSSSIEITVSPKTSDECQNTEGTFNQGSVQSPKAQNTNVKESVHTDARPQDENTHHQMIEKQTTKITFLVCTIFIASWIPPWVSFFLFAVPGIKSNETVIKIIMFGRMTYLINTVTNPIVYVWLNRKLRAKTLEIFRCRKITIRQR